MISEFRHFATPTTRRVSFIMASEDFTAAMRHPLANTIGPTIATAHPYLGAVRLTMSVATACAFLELLGTIGGDLAVAERMLRDALAGMVAELRASRNGARALA